MLNFMKEKNSWQTLVLTHNLLEICSVTASISFSFFAFSLNNLNDDFPAELQIVEQFVVKLTLLQTHLAVLKIHEPGRIN